MLKKEKSHPFNSGIFAKNTHIHTYIYIYIQLDYAPMHPKISLFGAMGVFILARKKYPAFCSSGGRALCKWK
jgi:hypothetical protein